MKRWTEEEDNVVLNAVKDCPHNLAEAFEAASQILNDRTPSACSYRWYSKISKRTDRASVALMCMSGKTVGINRKNCKQEMPVSQRNRFAAMWSRLIRFFVG